MKSFQACLYVQIVTSKTSVFLESSQGIVIIPKSRTTFTFNDLKKPPIVLEKWHTAFDVFNVWCN